MTPWVVLAMHRPMYVVFPHKSNRVFAGAYPPVESTYHPYECMLSEIFYCTSLHYKSSRACAPFLDTYAFCVHAHYQLSIVFSM